MEVTWAAAATVSKPELEVRRPIPAFRFPGVRSLKSHRRAGQPRRFLPEGRQLPSACADETELERSRAVDDKFLRRDLRIQNSICCAHPTNNSQASSHAPTTVYPERCSKKTIPVRQSLFQLQW